MAIAEGLIPGAWIIDPVHSEVGFSVRHLMVSKVRGKFEKFEGSITVADDPLLSSVTVTVDLSSINTGAVDRDTHLRSADFFEVDSHPTMTFKSTGVHQTGSSFTVDGELTIKAVTKNVQLEVEFNGVNKDPWGGTRAGFSAETEISRGDWGISFNMPLDGGGVVVGDKVKVLLEVEAVYQAPASAADGVADPATESVS
jgi:polyisoprenoid-binding protein YceI